MDRREGTLALYGQTALQAFDDAEVARTYEHYRRKEERNAHEEFRESIWEVPFEFNQYFSMVYCGARIFVLLAFLCLHSVRAESRCEPLCFRCCDGNATIQVLVHSRASC